MTYHSITCVDPCPGAHCQCDCHDCPDAWTPGDRIPGLTPVRTRHGMYQLENSFTDHVCTNVHCPTGDAARWPEPFPRHDLDWRDETAPGGRRTA